MTDPHFDHIVLPLLKSGLLDAQQILIIAQTAKLYEHLLKTMVRSKEIDFHPLAQYNLKYAEQEYIAQERVAMFLAAAIYYNFHMGSIMRF